MLVLLAVACANDDPGTAAQAAELSPQIVTVDGITARIGRGLVDLARTVDVDMSSVVSTELGRIQDVLDAPKTSMTIEVGWGGVIPEIGVGGGTNPADGRVMITVSPKPRVGLRNALVDRVPVTMAHELNHAKRILAAGRCWSKKRSTLSEALVCEGLADAFARQIYPDRKTPHSDALTATEETRMWTKMEPRLHEPLSPKEFWQWFASRGRGGIPHWTGYTIGFHIVRSYLRSHTDSSAADITLMDADSIIAGSGYAATSAHPDPRR